MFITRCHFYHAIVLCALIASGCGGSTPNTTASTSSSPSASRGPATSAPSSAAASSTPTGDQIQRGRDIIEALRTAAGGDKLTALRSIEATGTSTTSALAGARALSIRAMFPEFYRQEEIPTGRGGFGFAVGLGPERSGWMLGGRLGGPGLENAAALQNEYNRAASQAMAGFLAGVSAPWLIDTDRFTPVASGIVDAGDDRGLLIVTLEGPLGRVGRLLVDPATHLPRHFVEPPQPGPRGRAGRNDVRFTYSGFKDVNGIQLPHTIVRNVGLASTTWTISKYTLNPKIRPVEFTRKIAANVR